MHTDRPRPSPAVERSGAAGTGGFARRTKSDDVITAEAYSATFEEFAGRVLAYYVERPVVDRTSLAGRYDFRLVFSREGAAASFFTAVQEQLGLKLAADRAKVNVMVVDSAERPSAN